MPIFLQHLNDFAENYFVETLLQSCTRHLFYSVFNFVSAEGGLVGVGVGAGVGVAVGVGVCGYVCG